MANRDQIRSTSTPPITGPIYADNVAGHLKILLDKISLPVAAVTGTNTITGTVDPSFDSDGLVTGMKFSIIWAATNTSTSVNLNINGVGAEDIRLNTNVAPAIGDLVIGSYAMVEYDGTNFRLVADTPSQISATAEQTAPTSQIFTSNGTWTKPTGVRYVKVTVTGGGGGGGGGGGSASVGRGGATAIKYIDVTGIASATITVGAGATGGGTANSTAGNDSTWSDGTNTVVGKGGPASSSSPSVSTGGDINTATGDTKASYWGAGGLDTNTSTDRDATTPGSGGGVPVTSGTGGSGAGGIITVEEFY